MMTWSGRNTAELFINYYYPLWGPEMLHRDGETALADFIADALKQNQ